MHHRLLLGSYADKFVIKNCNLRRGWREDANETYIIVNKKLQP